MADVVTDPSQFLASVIQRHFGISVVIVSNILDHSIFRFRERPAVRPRLVVARQLEEIYDIESVLKAFREIQERHPDACPAVAGTGSQEGRLRALSREWGLRGVSFLGHVAHDDLPRLYAEYDIFINASRVDNFPGALVEASAAGLALVTTAAGGIPFMYEHEKDALLAPPGNWQALADAVETLLESPALARRLTKADGRWRSRATGGRSAKAFMRRMAFRLTRTNAPWRCPQYEPVVNLERRLSSA